MTATFIVEDGTGKSNANALITVAEADQIMENYSSSVDWHGLIGTPSEQEKQAAKENAIREATRFINVHYQWKGYRTYLVQALQWPRGWCYDDEGNYVDINTIPEKVKEACAYLALKVAEGNNLLEDLENAQKVKRTKDVIGPLTEEIEFIATGESPGIDWQVADKLVAPYIERRAAMTDLYRI